jgi:hypothetical protein
VEIVKTLSEIPSKLLNGLFWQPFILLNELIEISSSAVFKYYPEMVPSFIPIKKL